MNEQEAYLTAFYWLADSWLYDNYFSFEKEIDIEEFSDPIAHLLDDMQPGATKQPNGDDETWQVWHQAVAIASDASKIDETEKLVIPAELTAPVSLSDLQAYGAMAIFLQRQADADIQRWGRRIASQTTGSAWKQWQEHRASMHPAAAPATLTAKQLQGATWAFLDKYSVGYDPFELRSFVASIEEWQTTGDSVLDEQWRAVVKTVGVDVTRITLEQGLDITLAFLDQADWEDTDLAEKATLQNKLTQRTIDGHLNPETMSNWKVAWQHWNLAAVLTTENWASDNLSFTDDEDYDDDGAGVRPAWQLGAVYSALYVILRLILLAVGQPGRLPTAVLSIEMSNQVLTVLVSILIIVAVWLLVAAIITSVIWLWRRWKLR